MEAWYIGAIVGVVFIGGSMWLLDKRSPTSYGITGALLGLLAIPLAYHQGGWANFFAMFFVAIALFSYVGGLWVNRITTEKARRGPHYVSLASGIIAMIMPMLSWVPGVAWLVIITVSVAVIVTAAVMYRLTRRPDDSNTGAPHRGSPHADEYSRGDRVPDYQPEDVAHYNEDPHRTQQLPHLGGVAPVRQAFTGEPDPYGIPPYGEAARHYN